MKGCLLKNRKCTVCSGLEAKVNGTLRLLRTFYTESCRRRMFWLLASFGGRSNQCCPKFFLHSFKKGFFLLLLLTSENFLFHKRHQACWCGESVWGVCMVLLPAVHGADGEIYTWIWSVSSACSCNGLFPTFFERSLGAFLCQHCQGFMDSK